MELWIEWWKQVRQLRPSFSRTRTFMWFAVVLAAMCVRTDFLGVTSLVRALGLQNHCYDRLLDFFHSRAIKIESLTQLWTRVVLSVCKPFLYIVGERIVLVTTADEADPAALRAYSKKAGVPELMVPGDIVKVGEIPVLGSGKTDYTNTRKIALEKLGVEE